MDCNPISVLPGKQKPNNMFDFRHFYRFPNIGKPQQQQQQIFK